MSNSIQKGEKMAEFANIFLWEGLLPVLLLGMGLILTVKLRFFQIIKLPYIIRNTFLSLFSEKDKEKRSSQLRAVTAALGASMGTGNIVGVTSALMIGGAGAVFWMWVSAVLGMALSYGENYLGVLYKRRNMGGAPAYLRYGTGKRYLGVIFCLLCILASLGMGNMTQINSISQSIYSISGIDGIYIGLVCGGAVLFIISGSLKRIGTVSRVLLPLLSVCYILAALSVIIVNRQMLPHALKEIFGSAFGLSAVGGGVCGEVIRRSISVGLRRGVFSNEAGLGSSTLFHASVSCAQPQTQGMWAAAEVFLDTIVCCTLTALAVLTSGSLKEGASPSAVVSETFAGVLGGYASGFTCISVVLFAFATIISWYYCGECCVKYVFGESGVVFYRLIFTACIVIGAYSSMDMVWELADIFNGLMALPNLYGVWMLRKKVRFAP